MSTMTKQHNVLGHEVVLSLNTDTFMVTTTVDGEELVSGELKDLTMEAAEAAISAFGEDEAKGAAQIYESKLFFNQEMGCKKSFDCLGGMINVAMVAPNDLCRKAACVVSVPDENGEWHTVAAEVVDIADDHDVQEMLHLYTQEVANQLAISYIMTGELPFGD